MRRRDASLTKAAVVIRQLVEADALAGREGAQAGLAVLGPGKHGGGVERSLVGGAVAGGLAAASLELVDRALNELAQGEEWFELPLVVGQQGLKGHAQAPGPIGARGQVNSPFMLNGINT